MTRRILRSRMPHTSRTVARAISFFFAVRGIVRTKLARGRKLDPSTWLQVETMKFIADHDTPRMKDIAAYLSITAPSTTSLIGGLIKGGLVQSHADRRDRRTSRLSLTAKGKTELKASIARGMKILGTLFSSLSEGELTAFISALERLQDAADA